MPVFTSFDEAHRWFMEGGELVPLAEQREQFTQGRAAFLSFQARITTPEIVEYALEVQDTLADIDAVSPFPDDLLHISIAGLGWQVIEKRRPDDVLRQDVPTFAEKAAYAVRGAPPIEIEAGPVNVFPDALILEVHDPARVLAQLRRDLIAATRDDAFGFDDSQYLPHITVATFVDRSCEEPLRERMAQLREIAPAPAVISRIEFTRWWLTGVDFTDPPEADVIRSYKLSG